MKGMGSCRVADKNRIKSIPGRPVNRKPVSNDVVSLAAFSMYASLEGKAVYRPEDIWLQEPKRKVL